jgi:tetratricopeptide (TPR) repeat protein
MTMDARSGSLDADKGEAEGLLAFAEERGPALQGREAGAAYADIEARLPHILRAVDEFLEAKRTEEALRVVIALNPFWMASKRLDEGLQLFERALTASGGTAATRGKAYFMAGLLAFWKGEDERSAALHDRALAAGRDEPGVTAVALALSGHARLALRRDDVAEARRLCEEALALTAGTDDRAGRSSALHVLAVAAQMGGQLLEAQALLTERIALLHEAGNLAGEGLESGNLSMVERQLGNLDRAEELARFALEVYHHRSDEWAIPFGLSGLAAVAAERGDFNRAAVLIGAAEALMEVQGAAWPPDERPHYERTVEVARDALGADTFERTRADGRAMTTAAAVHLALHRGPAGQSRAGAL